MILNDWWARFSGWALGALVLAPWYVWVWRGVCKVLSYPAAWIVALLTALALLSGCAGTLPYNPSQMTPEQITASAKDKNAAVTCAIANGPWGRGTLVTVQLDQKVIPAGTVTVDSECKTTITNGAAK